MLANIKIFILGDIVAKMGRHTVAQILPDIKKKYSPDVIIGNIENLAHGKGITIKTLNEMRDAGITAFTGGNHAWKKTDPGIEEIRNEFMLALPANDPRTIEPLRSRTVPVGTHEITILNFEGSLMMSDDPIADPFRSFDELYSRIGKPRLLIIDFHAEITSEKVAFGHYTDGRSSLVYGTHTHIPTADAHILEQGTGFITDVGMTGSYNSVLGVEKSIIIDRFLGGKKTFQYPETGQAWLNGIYCELDPKTGHCTMIKQVQETLIIN